MLKIENLTKYYGKKEILKNLNLNIEKGKILGILGPNGSGKTTLLKIIAGLSRLNSGKITIDELPISVETKKIVSYLSDKQFLDSSLKIKDAIELYNDFFDFDKDKALKLINELDLDINSEIFSLSKGMKEKVYLILTLSRNAKLYILDEPIAGVDIITRDQILKMIVENIYSDATVIVTTHLIRDIEKIFDNVCFLKDGKIEKIYDVEKIREENNITVEDLYKEIFKGCDLDA